MVRGRSIVEAAKQLVRKETLSPQSRYGWEPYEFHFVPMVKYASILAKTLGADREIVEIAAWLHDIGSIRYGRKDHHLTSADIARDFLRGKKYPEERLEKVVKCILRHRGSTKDDCETLEEKIVSDADAISNFESIAGLFKAAYVYEGLDQGEAQKSVKEKLERKWRKLYLPESKKLTKKKYEAMLTLLEKQ